MFKNMSIRQYKYGKLYGILEESIDWKSAQTLKLTTNTTKRVEIGGIDVGILIQNIPINYRSDLRVGSVLYNNYNPKTYYNFGFEIEESTNQLYKTDYKTISKILEVVIKSLFEWIKINDPEVITIFSDAKNPKEKSKKLSIFGSILEGNKDELKSLGYGYDGSMGGNRIIISKYSE